MPRFYFDIADGENSVRDTDGIDLSGLDEARKEALRVLPDVAREVMPDGDNRNIVARVRDESGRFVFQATLSLTAEWLQ